ncbi:MAG: hypothetical protein GY751_09510, partial [Bacteroidetes bacterium]|nr:hypothetical protein [Bacteroidota bacterium]
YVIWDNDWWIESGDQLTLGNDVVLKFRQKDTEILRVHLKKGNANIHQDCDIMIDQVRAIDNKRLIKRIGKLGEELSDIVKSNLTTIMDLE